MRWRPFMNRCDLADNLRDRGIEPPRIYALGYPHNNCGGACILAGISQWAGVLIDNPELYARSEANEQKCLAALRKKGLGEFTILRDRRGGETKTLSLKQLREEIESGIRQPRDSWRESSCQCIGLLF